MPPTCARAVGIGDDHWQPENPLLPSRPFFHPGRHYPPGCPSRAHVKLLGVVDLLVSVNMTAVTPDARTMGDKRNIYLRRG